MLSPFFSKGTVQVKNHAGFGGAWFEDDSSEIVGEVTKLHAFLNVRAALDQPIPDARPVRQIKTGSASRGANRDATASWKTC